MKYIYLPVLLLMQIVLCSSVGAKDTFSANIQKMWFAGNQKGVLKIAQARLDKNPNDIAGLLMKLAYEIDVTDVDQLLKTADKITEVAQQIETPAFKENEPLLKAEVENFHKLAAAISAKQIEEDRKKSGRKRKRMPMLTFLEAAEKDGLIDEK